MRRRALALLVWLLAGAACKAEEEPQPLPLPEEPEPPEAPRHDVIEPGEELPGGAATASDTSAEVEASTVSGNISNDFGLTAIRHQYVGHSLHGQLGGGGAMVKLSNVNGTIEISHASDGKTLSPATNLERGRDRDRDHDDDRDDDDDD